MTAAVAAIVPTDVWLTKFPGEVRNEVYAHLVSSGELAMMRTSRQVCEEMLKVVLDRTPYRMSINYPGESGDRSGLPPGRVGLGIQRLEVRWRLPDYHDVNDNAEAQGSTAGFDMDCGTPRKRCVVYLEKQLHRSALVKRDHWTAWRRLVVFEEVVFRVVLKDLVIQDARGAENGGDRFLGDQYMMPLLEVLGKGLSAELGVAEQGCDGEGPFLTFHPGRNAPGRRTGWQEARVGALSYRTW